MTISPSSLNVKGHAGYDIHGKDIVCAAISTITLGSSRFWSSRGDVESVNLDNEIEIRFSGNDPLLFSQFQLLVGLYRQVSEAFPNYVKLKLIG